MSIGNRIYTSIDRPGKELVEAFRGIPSSNVGDMMNRLYCMRQYLRRIGSTEKQLLGTAFTVRVPDGDNAFLHMALDLAEPGDILVVDGSGCMSRALMGEIMFTYAQNKGIAGIIIDGAIRDNDSLKRLEIPVYAAAITPQGPFKNGPGEINVPVACGGQVVFPGDILIGDADGVCVVRKEEAPALVEAVQKKHLSEEVKLHQYHTAGNDSEAHQKAYQAVRDAIQTEMID
ncbi:MAG: RraA family protein [Lachnospiraceae bacterium]|nr:RraA family protein [Lachnospiraceae bacterium]